MLIGQQCLDFDSDYQWQSKLRHIALKGLSVVLPTSKGEIKAFPPPFPPCNVVLLFELLVENSKHTSFEWRGGEGKGVQFVLFSEVALFEYWCLNIFVANYTYLWPGITWYYTFQWLYTMQTCTLYYLLIFCDYRWKDLQRVKLMV